MSLILAFRDASSPLHKQAESHPLIRHLFGESVSCEQYAKYLSYFLPVYKSLDTAAANSPISQISQLEHLGLERSEAIESDLRFFGIPTFSETQTLKNNYANRIKSLEAEWPLGVVAHFYTRYLGDLAGGQMIAARLGKTLNLKDGKGLSFYQFPKAQNARSAAIQIRDAIDAIPLNSDDKTKLAKECSLSFQLNIKLFDDIWENWQTTCAS